MTELKAGQLTELAPAVHRLIAPNPGVMTGPGTNSYLFGKREITVLDPGPNDPAHVDTVIQAAHSIGGSITRVLVTHTHPDHSPAAAALQVKTGAELVGCTIEQDGFQDDTFKADREPVHDEVLSVDGAALRAIYSPGHVGNHFCYLHEDSGLLFTGDHVMQGSTVVIIPPAGDMKDYIDSLWRMLDYPLQFIAPGHGGLIPEPKKELEYLVSHRLKREAKVAEKLAGFESASLEELVVPVYDDVDPSLHPMAQLSLWAHLLKLQREKKALEHGGRWSLL